MFTWIPQNKWLSIIFPFRVTGSWRWFGVRNYCHLLIRHDVFGVRYWRNGRCEKLYFKRKWKCTSYRLIWYMAQRFSPSRADFTVVYLKKTVITQKLFPYSYFWWCKAFLKWPGLYNGTFDQLSLFFAWELTFYPLCQYKGSIYRELKKKSNVMMIMNGS